MRRKKKRLIFEDRAGSTINSGSPHIVCKDGGLSIMIESRFYTRCPKLAHSWGGGGKEKGAQG